MGPNNRKHVFVCTNDRGEGSTCCMNVGGMEIFRALKTHVLQNGKAGEVYVTKTGCLGFCNNEGANVVIYPEGKWFLKTKEEDLEEINQLL